MATTVPAEAAKPEVVLIVLDEFPGDALLDARGQVDPIRYPGFAELAADGWWFRNASTVFDDTRQAVPAVLTGKLPRRGKGRSRSDNPDSIYDAFGKAGYRIRADEDATALCGPPWCAARGNPDTIKNLRLGRTGRLRSFIRGIPKRRGRPTLSVKHTLLPHVPYLLLPSGRRTRSGVRDAIPGMNSTKGYGDPFLTRHNEQRFLLQLGWLDGEIRRLIGKLKRLGTYNRTIVAVTADHGSSFETGVHNRRLISRGNIDEVGPVPFFVKPTGPPRRRVSRRYVRTVDMTPTLADLANVRIPYRTGGGSAFGPAARRRRAVRIPTRNFSRTVVIGARAWERRRRAVVRRRIRRYGSGDRATLFTRIGPRSDLIGKPVARLATGPRGRVRAAYVAGGRLRRYSKSSAIAPTQVAGTLRGGGGRRRNLALAVNGTITVTGRSWYLRGERAERFALNIPEASLRQGRNQVELFELRGNTLVALGRA